MPTTPRRSTRIADPQSPIAEKKRLDGLWKDGEWWCNCEPRKKAVQREVTKNTPNKGKLFWKCNVYPYCNFFLWRGDAKLRERTQGSLGDQQGDGAEEPPKTPTTMQKSLASFGFTSRRRRDKGDSSDDSVGSTDARVPTPSSTSREKASTTAATSEPPGPMMTPVTPASAKRKRPVFEAKEEFESLDFSDEEQLVAITETAVQESAKKNSSNFTATPHHQSTAIGAGGLPTPSVSRTLFPQDHSKRQKTVAFQDPTAISFSSTETLGRDASPPPPPPPSATQVVPQQQQQPTLAPPPTLHSPGTTTTTVTDDPSTEIIALLRDQTLDPATLSTVTDLLHKSARRAKGHALGCESARAALKEKNDQIARLKVKIARLEDGRKEYDSSLTKLKAGLMKMYEDV